MKSTSNTGNKKPNRKFKNFNRRKPCVLCLQGAEHIDYKDVELLNKYIARNGKILPRRATGCCAKHQRMVANAIKRARIIALLPFIKD